MRAIAVAMLALAGCSAQMVKRVGPQQFLITGSGPIAFAKTMSLCKSPRYPRVSMPPDATNVECVLNYEIVPIAKDSYRIRASGTDTCSRPDCMPRGPNWEVVEQKIAKSGRDYCAKTHKVMVITDGSFDMGTGDEVIFRCVPPQEVESQIHTATCDGCGLTSDSPQAAVAYCNMRDLLPILKFTNANGMGYERGKPVPFSCVKKDDEGSQREPQISGDTTIKNR